MLDDSLGEINAKVDRPLRGRCQTLAASAAIISIEQDCSIHHAAGTIY
jgi:hypothetical protein